MTPDEKEQPKRQEEEPTPDVIEIPIPFAPAEAPLEAPVPVPEEVPV